MSVGFARDIKILFREKDRDAMLAARGFDLWDYADAVKWADAIKVQVESGLMPCDAEWPANQVEIFKKWIDDGKQP
jgi:hypothetical protein